MPLIAADVTMPLPRRRRCHATRLPLFTLLRCRLRRAAILSAPYAMLTIILPADVDVDADAAMLATIRQRHADVALLPITARLLRAASTLPAVAAAAFAVSVPLCHCCRCGAPAAAALRYAAAFAYA